jgi:hypothetical protein
MWLPKAYPIFLATASLSLSACTDAPPPKTVESGPQIKTIDPVKVTHGDLPIARDDGYAFNAVYDVLIFIKFNPDGSYLARVHHFKAAGNDFKSMKGRMEAAIDYLRNPKNIDGIPPLSLNSPTLLRSFKNMAFSAQSNVLIYVDNPKITYRDVPLFFTENLKNGNSAKKNKAFYDAAQVDITLTDNQSAKAAYVRNYFTRGSGSGPGDKPITRPERFDYAFNFNLNTQNSDDPNSKEQLILDPDGGNMGGGGPPP